VRIPRIYVAQPLALDCDVPLETASVHYLSLVLRLKPGAPLVAFDGSGWEFSGTVVSLGKKDGVVRFTTACEPGTESPLHTTLAIGISRGERMDYVVQKSTELGVNLIQPLFTEHCEVRLDDKRAAKRREHWHQVAISACEQSGRVIPPLVALPVSLQDWVGEAQGKRYLLDQTMATTPEKAANPGQLTLLIGPEGGISENEKALALGKGFKGLNLGARTLRTETAPVVALALFQHLWGN